MSTVRATNITDLTGTYTSTTTAINRGIAKAWVNFDGTTASPSTIRASYNVSSVTKNGTGDYTVNFTTALADANYSVSGTVGGSGTVILVKVDDVTTPRTSSLFRCLSYNYLINLADSVQINLVAFR